MSSLFLELSKQEKLLQMMEERGFTLCQQNGQRTYGGPPPNWGSRPPPSRDCEVFIGRLPRMCFEDELIPLFLTVGELYEFRLMLDFSGTNRGYGYAHYATLTGATNAIKILNKYEIRPGHHIGVLKSKNNCRLLFGNIKSNVTLEDFNEFIRSATDQVLNVHIFTDFNQLKMTDLSISLEVEEAFLGRMPRNNVNSQFAIVEYENHKAAAVARRVLIPKYGHILAIDWAVPPRERRRNVQGDAIATIPNRLLQLTESRAPFPLVKYATKARPVPTLMTRPSIFDNIPFVPKVFENVVKYFKYLINVSLLKCAQRGEIPLNVCKEIEKKIVERIIDLENCGQAVQLIFNYLSWYNEKKPNTIDLDAQKVLQEVKIYSDSCVHYLFNKLTYGSSSNPALDDYYCNVLPTQLNLIFHMALISTGELKSKLSGRITASLQWLNDVTQKVKNGTIHSKEQLKLLSRIMTEINETNAIESDEAKSLLMRSTFNHKPLMPDTIFPTVSTNQNDLQKHIVKAHSISGSSTSSYQTLLDDATESSNDSDLKGSLEALKTVSVDDDDDFSLNQYKTRNLTFNAVPDLSSIWLPTSKIGLLNENVKSDIEESMNMGRENSTAVIDEAVPDLENCSLSRPVPTLTDKQSITENPSFMPKAYQNVVRYFKYLINVALHRSIQRSDLTLPVCKEIERRIVDRIGNLESCSQAVVLIMSYLYTNNYGRLTAVDDETEKVLQDVKIYSDSFINYIYVRGTYGQTSNRDMDEYYCKILPLQLSFLFHLALILNGDEKAKLSGRISVSLQWLSELIHKNRSGDIELMKFFERISQIALKEGYPERKEQNPVKSLLLKEAYNELNMIFDALKSSSNYYVC